MIKLKKTFSFLNNDDKWFTDEFGQKINARDMIPQQSGVHGVLKVSIEKLVRLPNNKIIIQHVYKLAAGGVSKDTDQ